MTKNKPKTVLISGGFDPIHGGHIDLINQASKLGDRLVVVLNNNNWVKQKKGFVFMHEEERKKVLEAISGVDEVVITSHQPDSADVSVIKELEQIRPDIFANGGDRKADNIPEYKFCEQNGIEMVFNVGGEKTQSSSELVKKIKQDVTK